MTPAEESIFDTYLDAAVRGDTQSPTEFLSEYPGTSDELRSAIQAVHRAGTSTDQPREEGRRLGEFRLLSVLGEGGMGVVHLAEQPALHRKIALKVMRSGTGVSLTANARFEREARAAAKLSHPSIVTVYGVGDVRGIAYIAMEYVEGRGLDEIIASESPIAPARAVRWAASLARALAYAHSQDIIHRDVKPSNVRIRPDDRPVLLDFGVARDLAETGATLTEGFVGSPFFAAPEQVGRSGKTADARTDVYGLGGVLYQCLTGHSPVEPGTLEQVLQSIITDDPPSARTIVSSVPRDLSLVVQKALAKDPARRYQSAARFADDLDAVLELRPVSVRAPGALDRARSWSRRHRAAALTMIAVALSVVVTTGAMVVRGAIASAERRRDVAAMIAEASAATQAYAASRATLAQLETRQSELVRNRFYRYYTPEQDQEVDENQRTFDRVRRERNELAMRVITLAAQIERQGGAASMTEADRLRAELYFEQFLDAEREGDVSTASTYRDLMRAHDPGDVEERLVGLSWLTVEVTPQSAELHLFRRVPESSLHPSGESRMVLEPLRGGEGARAAGEWGVRIIKAAGSFEPDDVAVQVSGAPVEDSLFVLRHAAPFEAFDRIASIDGVAVRGRYDVVLALRSQGASPRSIAIERAGQSVTISSLLDAGFLDVIGDASLAIEAGASARVWRNGAYVDVAGTTGILARINAAPAYLGPGSRLPNETGVPVKLDAGEYVVIARAPGHETRIVSAPISRGASPVVRIALLPDGSSPPGFVHIGSSEAEFWVMEREVTMRDYFEFVNDPATLAEIAANPRPIRYPYDADDARGQRDAAGRFTLPEKWEWDWPVLLVTLDDARAYARWHTARLQTAGFNVVCQLPTLDDLVTATASQARFVWGDVFRPKWTSSCFARAPQTRAGHELPDRLLPAGSL